MADPWFPGFLTLTFCLEAVDMSPPALRCTTGPRGWTFGSVLHGQEGAHSHKFLCAVQESALGQVLWG